MTPFFVRVKNWDNLQNSYGHKISGQLENNQFIITNSPVFGTTIGNVVIMPKEQVINLLHKSYEHEKLLKDALNSDKPTINSIKQNNGWSYAIWQTLDDKLAYVQSPDGVWYQPKDKWECIPEPGDLDKIRMEFDWIIKDNRINDCLELISYSSGVVTHKTQ
jgi:hypothetical protein